MSKRYFNLFVSLQALSLSSAFTARGDIVGVQGRYTNWLDDLISSQNYKRLLGTGLKDTLPVAMSCLETPGSRFYIGVTQSMTIQAPIAAVDKVIQDIDHYAELFPGYASVKTVSREGDQILTAWEQRIPVFFIPNVKFEMVYRLGNPSQGVKVFRYQLHKVGNIKESDGFIVLTDQPDHTTQYLEVDFFDANWGILETFAPGKIWPESVNGLFVSDVAIKVKAENPAISDSEARKIAEKTQEKVDHELHKSPGDFCADHRVASWETVLNGLKQP